VILISAIFITPVCFDLNTSGLYFFNTKFQQELNPYRRLRSFSPSPETWAKVSVA